MEREPSAKRGAPVLDGTDEASAAGVWFVLQEPAKELCSGTRQHSRIFEQSVSKAKHHLVLLGCFSRFCAIVVHAVGVQAG